MNLSVPARLVVPLVVALGTALTTAPGTGQSADDTVGVDATTTTTTVTTSSSASRATRSGRGARLLIGEWRMKRLQVGEPGQREDVRYSGRIFFTEGGTVAVQARNPDEDAPDTPFATNGYESYYGPYTTNARTGRVAFDVRSSLVRALEGERLVRNYRVSQRALVLTPADPRDGFRVTYERVR